MIVTGDVLTWQLARSKSTISDSGSTTSPKDIFHCHVRNAMQKIESSAKSAKEIVMEFIEATERQDFQSARGYLKDNVSYVSPLNSFDRAEPYLKYNLHLYRTRTCRICDRPFTMDEEVVSNRLD